MKISENREERRGSIIKRDSIKGQSRKPSIPIPPELGGLEESDLTERFKVDINTKPMLDDERARKMIIGEL